MKTILILILFSAGLAVAQNSSQPIELKPILEVADSIPNAQFGAYVAGVGDLNHDGYADVAVSAPGLFKTYIYYGGKAMSKTPSLTLKGGGNIVSGDFRGNGWTDLAIDIPYHDTVLVYYNGPNGLDTIPDLILTIQSDFFGNVMTAGDFYGNGYTDLAIATMDNDKYQDTTLYLKGRIFIYRGGPSMNAIPVDTLIGMGFRAGLGRDLASGDVAGDGKDDIIALGYDESGSTAQTQYYYIPIFQADSTFHMRRIQVIDARQVPGGFGGGSGNGSVACFDADGDGIKDILVSGIDIFKGGATIDTLPTYRVGPPRGDSTDYGAYPWVGGGGDYNGDGIPDILLAPEQGGGLNELPGGVFVMVDGRGRPGQFEGYRIYSNIWEGTIALSEPPQNAGDVDAGGVDDIIVGNGGWPVFKDWGFFGIYSGDTSMVVAIGRPQVAPNGFKLEQNYPNPFNPSTAISYQLSPQAGSSTAVSRVTLKIYDTLGREVKTLVDNRRETPGNYTVYWDGTNNSGERVSSGTYFYQLTTDHGTETKKALYLK